VERLAGSRPVVERLFGGNKPLLSLGTADFAGDRVKLTGLPQGNEAQRVAALSAVGKVLASGPDGTELALNPAP
jgi:hypothetical protein